LSAITITISVRAPAHARGFAVVSPFPHSVKTNTGSEPWAPENAFTLIEVVKPMVRSKGAVSPVTRATASMAPVMIPGNAVGITTLMMTRHRGTPRA
jgi:hypothetical protein